MWEVFVASLLSGALGGGIAAWVGLRTQRLAADNALKLQRSANDAAEKRDQEIHRRHDNGIVRQVKALLRDLQSIIRVARRTGMVDVRKWVPVQSRLSDRIAQADVAIALTDDQAESAYGLAFVSGLALAVVDDLNKEFDQGLVSAVELADRTKATVSHTWTAFETIWSDFDDDTRLYEWRQWNDEVGPS